MICAQCGFDLRYVNMRAAWLGDIERVLTLTLECPQCATSFQISADQSTFSQLTAPERLPCHSR